MDLYPNGFCCKSLQLHNANDFRLESRQCVSTRLCDQQVLVLRQWTDKLAIQ